MGYELREIPTTFPGGAKPGAGSARSPAKARSKKRKGSGGPPRKAKAKKPCKYGPRDADGYCPKKPRRGGGDPWETDADLGYLPEAPKPRAEKPRKKTRAEAAASRRLNTALERAATRTISGGATKVLRSKPAARAVEGAARTARYLGTSVTALSGAGAAGAVGLAIAAGVGAFMATRSILARIRDRKERAQQAAFVAAQNIRQTRLDAEARLGRLVTKAELGRIRDAFNLTELMRKAGL